MKYNMTWFQKFLKKFFNFSKGGPLHILITISSITFDRESYGKQFIYHTTQLIETNRLVYKTLQLKRHIFSIFYFFFE
jgi:hypothetical protein